MSTSQRIVWMQIKLNVKHNVVRAIHLLMTKIGATFEQAARYCALVRGAA